MDQSFSGVTVKILADLPYVIQSITRRFTDIVYLGPEGQMFINYDAQITNLSLRGDNNIRNIDIRASRTIFSEVRVDMYDLCFAIVEH